MELRWGDYQKFKEFINKYGKNYDPVILDYITNEFGSKSDVLCQIYAKLGMLSDYENYYLHFAQSVIEKYGRSTNIIEIAGGYYPVFAEYVSKMQSSKGSITVYDPKLVVNNLKGVKLCREDFTSKVSLDNYDVVVGINPCDATDIFVKQVVEYRKQFYLAMCSCEETLSKFQYYVDMLVKLDNLDLTILLPENFEFRSPIIAGTKKKMR